MNGGRWCRRLAAALVCALAVAACDSPSDSAGGAGVPAALAVAGGDGQTGAVGQPLPQPVSVRIEDRLGQPVAGVQVSWETSSAEGSAAPAGGPTGADGVASTVWRLGPVPGTQQLTARVQHLPLLTLSAEARAGAPARIVVAPDILVLALEEGRDRGSVTAVVLDAFDNVASAQVEWSVPDATVAAVDGAGLVQAVGAGYSSVQARVGTIVGGAQLTVENPVPALTGTTPTTATAGAPGATVSLLGTGYVPTSVVLWDGAFRPSTFVSTTRLDVELTAADLAVARTATLRVMNAAPGGGSADHAFLVEPPVPTLRIIADTNALEISAWLTVGVEALDAAGQPVAAPPVEWSFVGTGLQGVLDGHQGGMVRARGVGPTRLAAAWAGMAVDTLDVEVRGTDARLTSVGAGNSLSCGLDAPGAAYCWGYHHVGVPPDGQDTYTSFTYAPAPVPGGRVFESLVVGHWHACGLDPDGTATCWYDDLYGQLGDGQPGYPASRTEPTPVAGGLRFRELAAGGWHTCGVTFDDQAWCWGANLYGQLGVGDRSERIAPTRVAGDIPFRSLFGQGYHTCGLTPDGRAYCWGYNGHGQLGRDDGGTCNDPLYGPVPCGFTPAPVATDLRFTWLAVGGSFTCGLTAGGAVWCWGSGTRGQLGDGVTGGSMSPIRVDAPAPFVAIDAGHGNACALTAGGQAWCWGQNDWGTNGVEPTAGSMCLENSTLYACNPVPVQVSGGHTFSALTAGAYHTCGMASSGRVLCWGESTSGELGRGGPMEGYYAAVPAPVYDGWMSLSAFTWPDAGVVAAAGGQTRTGPEQASGTRPRPDRPDPPAGPVQTLRRR